MIHKQRLYTFLGRTFTRTLLEHFTIPVEQMFYLYIKVFLSNIYII